MRPKLEEMTLRERIGQTGMPSPTHSRDGVLECGGYAEYFTKYPFCGMYLDGNGKKADGEKFTGPADARETFLEAQKKLKIPFFVACDYEYGGDTFSPELHAVSTNMALGAANDGELAYKRFYYWAREMRSCGVNWVFGPVNDLHKNFFSPSGIRRISADADIIAKLTPYILKGIHDAGVADSCKHYPGAAKDYRDSHFSSTLNDTTREEWYANEFKIWKAAVDAGAMSFMTGHSAFPAIDDSFVKDGVRRPCSASKKVLDIARKELNYDGVLITDAVDMKGLAAAFEHDDMYIECLNAGHDIVLFCHNDYIDVIEKAVKDGRVSEERVNEACRRVLDLKEKIGLFNDEYPVGAPLTEEEVKAMVQTSYDVAKNAMTLLNNRVGFIPADPKKIKKVSIITMSPDETFANSLQIMKKAFEKHGAEVTIYDRIKTKRLLKEMDEESDLIVYACFLAMSRPKGMSFYSRNEDLTSLFHALSYGARKSVVASFGSPAIYYNYFESADTYINAYSPDPGTLEAFVDGIYGEFTFNDFSPVPLKPEFIL